MEDEGDTTPTGPRVMKALFNHIALPIQLPQQQDKPHEVESALSDRLLAASRVMRDAGVDDRGYKIWESIRRSLLVCRSVNSGGRLERTQLQQQLRQAAISDVLILHVIPQNAGIVVSRYREYVDHLVELF